MDHLCSKCGASVQDGVPFCPNCGAPQIRVANPFGDMPATPPMPPGTPGEIQPPAEPVSPWPLQQQQGFRSPTQYDWRAGWRTALSVGVAIGIFVSARYIGGLQFCCFWTLAGGTVAAILYRRNADLPAIPVSIGFRTGMLTGLVAYLVNTLALIAQLATGAGAELRRQMKEQFERSMAEAAHDPQATAVMQRFVDWTQTPEGFAWMVTLSLIVIGIGFVLFTGLGGALGASMFGKKSTKS